MSLRPVTFYQVECDHPECDHCTADYGDYAAWADPEQASEDWKGDNQIIDVDSEDGLESIYLCDDHRVEVDL